MKQLIRRTTDQLKLANYHLRHRRTALTVLKNVEKDRGALSDQLKKECTTYAKEVLGWQGYAPWLYVFAAMNGEFREGWIPDNFYGSRVVPGIKGNYGVLSNFKTVTPHLFDSANFPDLAFRVNGRYYDKDHKSLAAAALKPLLFKDSDRAIFKLDHGTQGTGIQILNKATWTPGLLDGKGDGVFQAFIKQHPDFDQFTDRSVATIRLTTVLEESGEASLRAAYLRLGAPADSHVQSASHIRVPIAMETGKLDQYGYDANWRIREHYPGNNKPFGIMTIPYFSDCVRLARELHKKVPFVQCIGWDMVTDSNGGVHVMEWNGEHNDIRFTEATQGPCFADLNWERFGRRAHVN